MDISINNITGGAVLNITGKIDTLTSPELQEAVMSEIANKPQKLVLDLSAVNYISSAGLRVLLIAQKSLKPTGGNVILVGANDSLKEIFNISGFTALFTFADTISDI
jgi:anti-anti-sigma factor